jgi:hypothetical protein
MSSTLYDKQQRKPYDPLAPGQWPLSNLDRVIDSIAASDPIFGPLVKALPKLPPLNRLASEYPPAWHQGELTKDFVGIYDPATWAARPTIGITPPDGEYQVTA